MQTINNKKQRNSEMTALSRKSRFPKLKFKGLSRNKKKNKKKNKEREISKRYNSPERSKTMPSVIEINPGTPNSPMSQVSGATGLIDRRPITKAHSMMRSALPTLETDSVQSNSLHASQISSFEPPQPRRSKSFAMNHHILHSKTMKEMLHKGPRYLRNSTKFQKLLKWAFDTIDTDKCGSVDKKELYAGLILIHLQLAAYVGPAACRPASRKYVDELFDKMDWDRSGTLDREEFGVVMTMLMSQMATRIATQLSMTLLIVPIASQYVLDVYTYVVRRVKIILNAIDNAEQLTERIYVFFMNIVNFTIPPGMKKAMIAAGEKIDEFVPDDAYDSLPLTIISIMLGMLLIPWILNKIDAFYDWIATATKRSKK